MILVIQSLEVLRSYAEDILTTADTGLDGLISNHVGIRIVFDVRSHRAIGGCGIKASKLRASLGLMMANEY